MKFSVVLVLFLIFCFARGQADDRDSANKGSNVTSNAANVTTKRSFFSLFFDAKPFHFIKNSFLKIFRRNRTRHKTTVKPTAVTTEFTIWRPHTTTKMEHVETGKVTKLGEKSSSIAKTFRTSRAEHPLETHYKTRYTYTTREKFTTSSTTEKAEKMSSPSPPSWHSESKRLPHSPPESSRPYTHISVGKHAPFISPIHYFTAEQHTPSRPSIDRSKMTTEQEPYQYPTAMSTRPKYFNVPPQQAHEYTYPPYPRPTYLYSYSTRYRPVYTRTYRTYNEYYYTRRIDHTKPSYLFTRTEHHSTPETTYLYTNRKEPTTADHTKSVVTYPHTTDSNKPSEAVSSLSHREAETHPFDRITDYHLTKYDHYRNYTRYKYTRAPATKKSDDLTTPSSPSAALLHELHSRSKYTASTFRPTTAVDTTTSTSAHDLHTRGKYTVSDLLRSQVSDDTTTSSAGHVFTKFHPHSKYTRSSPSTSSQNFFVHHTHSKLMRNVSTSVAHKREKRITFLRQYGKTKKTNEMNSLMEEPEYHSLSRSCEEEVPDISDRELSEFVKFASKKRAVIDNYLQGKKSIESSRSSSEIQDGKHDLSYWYYFTGTVPDVKKLIITRKHFDFSDDKTAPVTIDRRPWAPNYGLLNFEAYRKCIVTRHYTELFQDIEIRKPTRATSRSNIEAEASQTHHVETDSTTIPTFPTWKASVPQDIDPYGLLRKIMHYNVIRRPLLRNGTNNNAAPSRLHPLHHLPPFLNLPITLPRKRLMYTEDEKHQQFTLLGKYRIHKNNKTLECVQFPSEFSVPFYAVAPPTQSGFYRVMERYRIGENKTIEMIESRMKNGSAHNGVVPYEKSRTIAVEIRFYPLRTNPTTPVWKVHIPTVY